MKDKDANPLLGLTVGSEVDASFTGISGKLKITGGSDKSGVPMRSDIHGTSRKFVLLSKGVGLQDVCKGERIRKLVRANTISEEIFQVNCKFDGTFPEEPKESHESPEPKESTEPKQQPTEKKKE